MTEVEEENENNQQEEEESQEDPKAHLTPDFFYDDDEMFNRGSAKTDFDSFYSVYNIFGFDLARRYNAIPINETTLIISVGNFALFYNVVTGEEQIIKGHNKNIQCAAVHPNHEYVALGEEGRDPLLLIYQFPSLKLFRILRGGTEAAFTALNFSPDGKLLAAVGTFPDYMLTVWDWERENLVLRAKAFSQDVFRVTFSDNLAGRLVTSGVGHIRLWEMAKTFTGLKLQGEIGKFGNIEISDTSGYAMFPDGKVLSGSESGSLLLWEDALVKCEFCRKGGKRCHKGMVEVVYHNGHDIISAGRDGCIRVWDFSPIDTAETEDTSVAIDIAQKSKLRISKKASIRSMYPFGSGYLVVDSSEGLWKADLENKTVEPIHKFHAGAIRTIAFSPSSPMFVTGGDDGCIRLWDVSTRTLVSEIGFEAGCTKILWNADGGDNNTIFAGFADGCLRLIIASAEGLVLKQPLKPHTSAINDIVQAPTSKLLATTGDDGVLFFIKIDELMTPLGFVYINGRKPKTKEEITQEAITGKVKEDDRDYARGLRIRWTNVISVECSDNTVSSVSPPTSFPTDGSESFFIDIPVETTSGSGINDSVTSYFQVEDGDIQGKRDGFVKFHRFSRKVHSDAVTAICISPDDDFLVTGSESGELICFKRVQAQEKTVEQVQLKHVEVTPVEDIKSGNYSIEEEKQKSELDRRIKAAEQQKDLVRQQIDLLRQRFALVVQQNANAPSYMQLEASAFKIDPFLFDLMEEESVKLEKDASFSTMFDAEKSRVQLRKAKERLVRTLKEEGFSVTNSDGTKEVTSFRITELNPMVLEVLNQGNDKHDGSDEEANEAQSETVTQGTDTVLSSVGLQDTLKQKPSKANKFGRLEPLKKVVHTPDEHLIKKQKRDARRRKIMDQKPPENYSDPADLREIEIAKNTIGDYKLKDDPKYIAPEDERVNATKKRRQLMLLLSAIHELKTNFNNKLKELAELKGRLKQSVDATNRELNEISGTIGCKDDVKIVLKDKNFTPIDLRDKIDINLPTPEAVSFAEQVASAARKRIEAQAGKQKQAPTTSRGLSKRKQQQGQKKKKADDDSQFVGIELQEMKEIKTELKFRRKMLIRNITAAIKKFDDKIEEAYNEKIRVHTEVVLAELRCILMLREFKLLAKLELRDGELNGKLKAKSSEMKAIDNEVARHQKEIKQKENEIEEADKELKRIRKKFDTVVDNTNKYHDQLLKIFNYNLRRDQDKNKMDEEEVDLTTLDFEAVRKMFEKQNMEKEEDACPAGCDPALFEKVLDLREEKMDIIDQISEANSSKDSIQRQCDSILSKRKGLETSYNSIKLEFEEFQAEKQRHLNELNFSLSIQFNQIKHLVTQEVSQGDTRAPSTVKSMPIDLSGSLVFTTSGLNRLIKQEAQLRADKVAASKVLASDIRSCAVDRKELNQLAKELEERAARLDGIQRLKFGEPVDLVELEQMKINSDADALRAQAHELEIKQKSEIEELNAKIKEMNERLTLEVQRNTAVLGELVKLTEQQRDIENVLQNSRNAQSADELNQDLELANPDEMLQEVERNAETIERLQEEINLLKRR